MDDIEVSMTGLSELQAALENLGGTEAKAIVRDGLSQGGDALRVAMMVQGASAKGEVGTALQQKTSWSKATHMDDDLAGTVRVGPKGALPDLHVARGGGMQPKGKLYRRSLNYIVRLLEFGGRDPAGNLGPRTMPMTTGYETYKGAVLEKVVAVIKERLGL